MIGKLTIFCLVLGALCWSSVLADAQDSLMVTKNFKFQDGFYRNFEELKRNNPFQLLDQTKATYFVNPQSFLAKVKEVRRLDDLSFISLDSIWAFCSDGIPYIRTEIPSVSDTFQAFVGLRVRGKISYFSYSISREDKVPIKAYNPANGKPFRTAWVSVPKVEKLERMLHWETGEIRPFNRPNFLEWIADDASLYETVEELTEEEVQQKLFKCLLIYDDRNPVYTYPFARQKE